MFTRRLEQLRDSVGPPPLEVPRKESHGHVPNTSPSLRMPQVFVHPPEDEDHNQPWCFFDAAQIPSISSPELTHIDVALSLLQLIPEDQEDTTPFQSETSQVVMPRKSALSAPGNDSEVVEVVKVPRQRAVAPGNDSQVVEIVRLHRNDSPAPVPSLSRSKTFRTRASKAFQSLKNAAKPMRRKAAHKHNPRGPQSSSQYSTLPPKSNVSRQTTVTLPQLFTPTDEPTVANARTPYLHLPYADTSPSLTSHVRAPFSKSSTARSFRRHLSVLDLFNFSTQPTPMSSDSSTFSFEAHSDPPDTPLDDVSLGSPFTIIDTFQGTEPPSPLSNIVDPFQGAEPSLLHSTITHTRRKLSADLGDDSAGDVTFEMRLDSLHFEQLSFDADNF